MATAKILFNDTDNLIQIIGLKDVDNDTAITAATFVRVTCRDSTGSDKAGETWPVALTNTGPTPTNGDWQAVLISDIAFSEDEVIEVFLEVDAGADLASVWKIPARVKYRDE